MGWIIQTERPYELQSQFWEGNLIQFALPTRGWAEFYVMGSEVLEGMRAAIAQAGGRLHVSAGFSAVRLSSSQQDRNLDVVETFFRGLSKFRTVNGARSFLDSEFMTRYRMRIVSNVKDMPKGDSQFFPPAVGSAGCEGSAGGGQADSALRLPARQVVESGAYLSAAPILSDQTNYCLIQCACNSCRQQPIV